MTISAYFKLLISCLQISQTLLISHYLAVTQQVRPHTHCQRDQEMPMNKPFSEL